MMDAADYTYKELAWQEKLLRHCTPIRICASVNKFQRQPPNLQAPTPGMALAFQMLTL
jgi:hypothetical protein